MKQRNPAASDGLIARYRSTCGLSEGASRSYAKVAERFCAFLADNGLSLEDVTPDTVVAYANFVDKGRGKPSKRNLSPCIRSFFRWLEAEGLIEDADGRVGAKGKHGKYSCRLGKSPRERADRRAAGSRPRAKPPGAPRNRNGSIDEGLIESFLAERARSKGSLAQLSCAVRAFSRFIEDVGVPLEEVTSGTVESFGSWAKDAYAESTRARIFSGVRTFFSWLEENGYRENVAKNLAAKGRRLSRRERAPLPLDAARKVLEAAGDNANVEIALRDRMIVGMMVVSALRPGEIRSADVGDVSFVAEHGVVELDGRPGKPGSVVYLPPRVAADARAYIEYRQAGPEDPLVASAASFNAGARLTATSVSYALERAFEHAGIEGRAGKYSLPQTALELAMEGGYAGAQLRSLARVNCFASLYRLDYERCLADETPQSRIEALLGDVEGDLRHSVIGAGELLSMLEGMSAGDSVVVSIDRAGKLSLRPVAAGGIQTAVRS